MMMMMITIHDHVHDHDDDAVLLLFLLPNHDEHKRNNSFGLHIKIPKGYRTFDIIKHFVFSFLLLSLLSAVRIIRGRKK